MKQLLRFQWTGSGSAHLDDPSVTTCGQVVIGRYGGRRDAGATSNEDAAQMRVSPAGDWELALLLDAHASTESAELVLDTISTAEDTIVDILSGPVHPAFRDLEEHVVGLFSSDSFRARCRRVRGETACLICARKEQFLWWLNVGDCLLYLLHPELAAHGQLALNQRNFYEWIGQVNTFDLPAPCCSSGVRALRGGRNVIVLGTDGLLVDNEPEPHFVSLLSPERITDTNTLAGAVEAVLSHVHQRHGRDSATIVAWVHESSHPAAYPTRAEPRD